jgi:uncharacterized paraquat-inducible protein A
MTLRDALTALVKPQDPAWQAVDRRWLKIVSQRQDAEDLFQCAGCGHVGPLDQHGRCETCGSDAVKRI